MQATCLPIEEYKLDTHSPQEQWQTRVNDTLTGLTRKGGNSNVITPLTYNFIDQQFNDSAFDYGNGYVLPPAPNQGYTFFNLPKPSNFKVRNVQNITLTLNISLQPADSFASSTSFTAPAYFYLGRQVNEGESLTSTGSYTFPWLIVPLGNLNYEPTRFTNPFYLDTPNYEFNLTDTITLRQDLLGTFDFSSDNDKIDELQYSQLLNTNNKMTSNVYIDSSGLTAGDITFFETIFPQSKYPQSAVALNYTLTFFYNGLASAFQPLS